MKKLIMPTLFAVLGAIAAGSASAQPVTYAIDSSHTYPSFRAPHMGISWWLGKFNKTTGTVEMDRVAGTGKINIVIDAASVDFGHEEMNREARKDHLFNVAKYPEITYEGTLNFEGDTPVSVDGVLTMIGQSRPVELTIDSFKCITHPMLKREVCGADVEGVFNRRDFGMTYGSRDEEGGVAGLVIQVEAIRQ